MEIGRLFCSLSLVLGLVLWQPVGATRPLGPPVAANNAVSWLPPPQDWMSATARPTQALRSPSLGGQETRILRNQVQALNFALRYRDNALAETRFALQTLIRQREQLWFELVRLRNWNERRDALVRSRIADLEAKLADAARMGWQRGQELAVLRLKLQGLEAQRVTSNATREKLEGRISRVQGLLETTERSFAKCKHETEELSRERDQYRVRAMSGARNLPVSLRDLRGRLEELRYDPTPEHAAADGVANDGSAELAERRRRALGQISVLRSDSLRLAEFLVAKENSAVRLPRTGAGDHAEVAMLGETIGDLETALRDSGASLSSRGGAIVRASAVQARVAELGNAYQVAFSQKVRQDLKRPADFSELSDQLFKEQSLLAQVVEAHGVYRVLPRDSLSRIAYRVYGSGERWPEIYGANDHLLSNPDLLLPGLPLVIP